MGGFFFLQVIFNNNNGNFLFVFFLLIAYYCIIIFRLNLTYWDVVVHSRVGKKVVYGAFNLPFVTTFWFPGKSCFVLCGVGF